MHFGTACWLIATVVTVAGERWRWPEGAQSVRIDTKVRFVDDDDDTVRPINMGSKNNREKVQADEVPFKEPTDTEGFYNRPPGSGRYPVRVEAHRESYRVDGQAVYPVSTYGHRGGHYDADGTLDSLQYCKCVSTPDCIPRPDPANACGAGMFLCCFKRPNKHGLPNSEFFNEIDDERPMLLPGQENLRGPFPPPPGIEFNTVFGQGHEAAVLGATDEQPIKKPVLVGPNGPTGQVGPPIKPHLVGPNGPTGNIGPAQNPNVLVGPNGPTGLVGPAPVDHNKDTGPSATAQRGVLVGPGGPTGIIGPYNQRPILVGPGGPSGIIGPVRGGNRGVLVGPGGPTGIIGPGYSRQPGSGYSRQPGSGYSRQPGPGLLVGPGGPTGTIGPGRQLLVGPGGPTGQIGPRRYFGN